MKLKMLAVLVFLLLLGEGSSRAVEKLNVVATFAPVFSLTKNVAGAAATVTMLLPPDIGPHDFALSPAHLRKIADADVLVSNGLGLETWLDKALKSGAKANMVRIVASDGIETIEGSDPPGSESGKHGGHHHEHDEGPNPHVWLDPIRAIKMVENIRDGLMRRDPDQAGIYQKNAEDCIARLRALHEEIATETSKLTNKRLLSFHDTMPYFAARYGFEIVGVFEPFAGKEPTPKYLKRLREVIKARKVTALFSEPQYSPQVLRSIADDLQVPIAVIDPMETGEPSADLYEKVMRSNLRTLISALHGS